MNCHIINPFSDELMIWDEITNQYKLTETALIRRGIDIRGKLAKNKANSPEYVINGFIETVSDMIYNYLHQFAVDTNRQDCFMAQLQSFRPILYRALLQQAIYMRRNGQLDLSLDDNVRKNAISPQAIQTLNTTIAEIGTAITYRGVW